jgi:acetolactate synthase-1/2/3 large subunit
MVEPVTKWAHRVTHTERIPELVAQALRIATSGRPGPVFLELPIDVLFSRVEESRARMPARIGPDTRPAPAPEAVARTLEWLEVAKRPAILVGGGAWFSGAGAALLAFAERTGTPVFSNGKAHGLVPGGHPLCGRGFGTLAAATATGNEADLLIVLGARLGMFTGGRGTPLLPAGARVVQIDVAGEEIGRNRDVDLAVTADVRESLRALDALASGRSWPDRGAWQSTIQGLRDGHRMLFGAALQNDAPPIHPYRLACEIRDALPEGTIVTADGGETATWMDMVADVRGGGQWLSHGYLGCLGTGMPFAIAAKVAHPERPVLCIVGDGSVGLNFAEFDTMVRHQLPIVTVVNNDQIWGMSAHGQDLIFGEGRRVVTELGPTRYERAAAGFGCHSEHVTEPSELRGALERAFASGVPACVNVMTDPSVISPITIAMVGGAKPPASPGAEGGGSVQIPYYSDLED